MRREAGHWVLYAAYKDQGLVQSYTFNYRHNDGEPVFIEIE